MDFEYEREWDVYTPVGTVDVSKLKKLRGKDITRALAEINTVVPEHAGSLLIFQRGFITQKFDGVKFTGKKDYEIAKMVCDIAIHEPSKAKTMYITDDLFKVCSVVSNFKIHPIHTVALTQDDDGNDVVASLGDLDNPIYKFERNNDVIDVEEEIEMKKENVVKVDVQVTDFKKGDTVYVRVGDVVVLAEIVKLTKTKVYFSYLDDEGEDVKANISVKAFEKFIDEQDELETIFNEQEEEIDGDEDDESVEEEEPVKPTKSEAKKSSGKYWEDETPIESITEGNIVNYYEEAKKLQLYRRIEKNGEFIKSKGVTIDVDAMSSKDALQMLSMMCYALKDSIDDERIKDLVDKMEFINQEYNTEQYLFSDESELDYDVPTLKHMAKNCGVTDKVIKSAKNDASKLKKIIIAKTQELNG